MNFLAHVYLSGTDEKLLVGNFIADFVKGKSALDAFGPEFRRGILLHRLIDAFTDTHPIVAESKDRLRPFYRHYAGVIVDVYYDHFLARYWPEFHDQPLEQFTEWAYAIVQKHEDVLPPRVREFFPYMVRGNWLLNYSKIEGIGRSLSGMARRTPYESHMELAVNDLLKNYDDFEKEFRRFFPDLQFHVSNFLD